MAQIENLPASVYYWGALGSIGVSAVLLLLRLRTLAVFVGLWPPTILLLGLFNRKLEPSADLAGSSVRMNSRPSPTDTGQRPSNSDSGPPHRQIDPGATHI